jgi:DNA modification methylase
MEVEINVVLVGDALERLKKLPSKYVRCIITSPPYFNLRDYKMKGQIGLESSPMIYINKLVEIFRECRRVLTDDGTLWINIGDSYASKGKNRTKKQASANSTLKMRQITMANIRTSNVVTVGGTMGLMTDRIK